MKPCFRLWSSCCLFAGLVLYQTITIAENESLLGAITSGEPRVDLRLRYEHVDQDNALDEADALTLRTRIGYGTGKFRNVSAYVEMENTSSVLVEDYNSGPGGNGKTGFSVVADPEGTEMNQAYLEITGIPNTLLKPGRQRIKLDNDRFVGNVGWRQNEQTYDAVLVRNQSLPDTTLTYVYLRNINNIFFEDVDSKTHLLNARYDGLPFGSVTGYGYFIEFPDSPATSQKTLGIRLAGSKEIEVAKLLYALEFASQSDYEDGNDGIDAEYRLLELGVSAKGITGKIGYESLGDDNFSGFETPLATKHAFNGWADVFLNTPPAGLQDVYLLVTGKFRGVKLLGVYHDFEADAGGADYGSELDLLAAKKIGKNFSAGIKYAGYDADDFGVDVDKVWIWGQLKF